MRIEGAVSHPHADGMKGDSLLNRLHLLMIHPNCKPHLLGGVVDSTAPEGLTINRYAGYSRISKPLIQRKIWVFQIIKCNEEEDF